MGCLVASFCHPSWGKMVVHLGDVLMNSGIKDIILVPGQRSDAGH